MAHEFITILHTNDLHSHIEHWPRIANWLKTRRAFLQAQGHFVLTFDIGDFIDRSDANTQASWGKANTDLLNDAGYDAVTIGNNEGLALPHDRMEDLYSQRKFAVLLDNILENNRQLPDWAEAYRIFVTPAGTRISAFGLTAAYESTYPLNDWLPVQPLDVLPSLMQRVIAQSDIRILLSHLGLPTDQALADHFNELSVILGAHTHHLLPHGQRVNQSILAAAGKYGENVGEVTLEIDNHAIVAQDAHTIKFEDLPEVASEGSFISNWQRTGRELLTDQAMAFLPAERSRKQQVNDCAEALMVNFHTQIAMLSTGMFLEDLAEGPLNAFSLLTDMPHTINPMKIDIDGSVLLKLFDEVQSQRDHLFNLHINGSGFRGDTFGEMLFFGIQKADVDPDAHYEIASLDHYYFLPWFHSLQSAEVSFDFHGILRELMADYYWAHYAFKEIY
ncbi:bifunctional metallophosphatase/5'-nucleotidase [Oenococcus kitaharae]|uniref:5-nucleotidase family protein in cluster with NagD-like phosphatase n=1 Tax=Oenococcus kitaharae DSM 17330 TaxID=1045004 RepID=G9WGC7_9LACO|nr:metallophosphoesterase [Oenococcus kitaharae]EHN59735.1 5-nucleotidase family protein in cluster with NagD-like phosphatase [Oenococcus kitaharae DSM 17330]OEY83563.1 metallophosphatase [Oenococcus kitaharae]OEY85361.1 metallophosphatase [Oenococcus kitaharae]OEY86214.1 metallophosphatase [Oenococcus kitaharae]